MLLLFVDFREIEAKKKRLTEAEAEGRGAEVALQEAAETAMKKIHGEKIRVNPKP